MLQASFQHLNRISPRRELELWRKGVLTWDDLEGQSRQQLSLFSDPLLNLLDESRAALAKGDAEFFASRLPKSEHYRIALAFPQDTIFLDIETTGLSLVYDSITLVGWSIGREYGVYYPGCTESEFASALKRSKVVVTFNGTLFDLPFIRRFFPQVQLPTAHVDLRFLARRAGIGGPQKLVESRIGISRGGDLDGIDGRTAVVLWHRYCRGSLDSLRQLVCYNHADIEGMKRIFDVSVDRLLRRDEVPWSRSAGAIHQFAQNSSQVKWSQRGRPGVIIKKYKGRVGPVIDYAQLRGSGSREPGSIVGIDLTGSEARPSGWALLNGTSVETSLVSTDDELVDRIVQCKPLVVSIDSPLSLPKGRVSVEDSDPGRQKFGITRQCERELRRRGVNVYPCLIPSMQKLTARGMRLAARLRQRGIAVIESYPGAAQDILGIPRKRASLEFLATGLQDFGLVGKWTKGGVSHDELDAITSALVGLFWWYGRFEPLGNSEEEYLIIPQPLPHSRWTGRCAVGFSGHISSGKTTAARHIAAEAGLKYTRFSLVLAEMLRARGEDVTRESLQRFGWEIHNNPGQRWLCKEMLVACADESQLIVDGLRYPEDHACLLESFGPNFLHVHVTATPAERAQRLGLSVVELEKLSCHNVESGIGSLSALAHINVVNTGSIDSFMNKLGHLLHRINSSCPLA